MCIRDSISTYLQVRSGTFDTHTRIAQSDRIPWDYVALISLLCLSLIHI